MQRIPELRFSATLGQERRDLEANRIFLRMAEGGLDLLGSDDPESQRSLKEMQEFDAYREEELSAALERRQEERKVRNDPV